MTDPASFDGFMVSLAARDPSAALWVSHAAFARLVGWVRGRIGDRYRSKVDADSVINSAVRTVIERHAKRPYELGGWDELWALFVVVSERKLSNHLRRFRSRARDAGREVTADAAADAPSPAAAPDAGVVLDDLLHHLLTGYTDDERAVIAMSLQGYSINEIEAELKVDSRTAVRIRQKFRTRVEAEQARDAAG